VIPLHPQAVEGWCVLTGEDTHESESSRYVDQGGHSGETEKLFSFCGSSSLRFEFELIGVTISGERDTDGMLLLHRLSVSKWEIIEVMEPDCQP